jgi:hypothetical protein
VAVSIESSTGETDGVGEEYDDEATAPAELAETRV